MNLSSFKRWLLPTGARAMTVWRGPFRGAKMHAVPASSLRKVLGLYEHELNDWIDRVVPKVDAILDVGANDGYFTFGCCAAFQRAGKRARIVAFEPEDAHCRQLADSLKLQDSGAVEIRIEKAFVGNEVLPGQTTLDAFAAEFEPRNTLLKIDVEGAELAVIEGASRWLHGSNYFLIEIHDEAYIDVLRAQFAKHQLPLELITQRPLPLIGRESRSPTNCWLVTPVS